MLIFHLYTVFSRWEGFALNIVAKASEGLIHLQMDLGVAFDKAGGKTIEHSDQVMRDRGPVNKTSDVWWWSLCPLGS